MHDNHHLQSTVATAATAIEAVHTAQVFDPPRPSAGIYICHFFNVTFSNRRWPSSRLEMLAYKPGTPMYDIMRNDNGVKAIALEAQRIVLFAVCPASRL